MEIMEIIQTVSTLGFPAIMCVLMVWYIKYMQESYREDISKITEIHKEETAELRKAVENNTEAVIKLCERLAH